MASCRPSPASVRAVEATRPRYFMRPAEGVQSPLPPAHRRGFGLIGITERMMAAGGGATWGEVGDLWVLDAFMPSLPAN